jgi:hypothetical protein
VFVFMNKHKKNAPGDASKKTAADTTPEAAAEEKKITTVFLATVFRCPAAIVNQ